MNSQENKLPGIKQMLVAASMLSVVMTLPVSAADPEFGEWQDILTPQQALGRVAWLERCTPGLLAETWDKMYSATELKPVEEKIADLKSLWIYDVNGDVKAKPSYPTFGDDAHKNPDNWYAGVSNQQRCTTIPSSYKIIGLMTASDEPTY